MRKPNALILFILPLFLAAQRFGVSQMPNTDESSSASIPVQQSLLPVNVISLEQPIDPDTYQVGPGDQIAIGVQTSESLEKVLIISPTGFLIIPGVGKVDLRGQNLSNAIQHINHAILQNFKNARVSSELVGIRRFKVAIVGAVRSPGFFAVTPVSRMAELLKRAKPRPMALLNQVKIKALNGAETYYDLTKFYLDGDLSQNPLLAEGDQIQVEYGDLEKHAIVVRGAVNRRGYAYVKPGETLADLIERRIDFSQNADLDNIKVVRKVNKELKFLTISPGQFKDFRLHPGDDIEFLYEKPVNVQGYVAAPGSFMFIPGYTAGDYVTLAGGLLTSGTMNRIKITRVDGSVLNGEDVLIQRGDIIEVPRSSLNIIFGDITVLQMTTTLATLILAYKAAVP